MSKIRLIYLLAYFPTITESSALCDAGSTREGRVPSNIHVLCHVVASDCPGLDIVQIVALCEDCLIWWSVFLVFEPRRGLRLVDIATLIVSDTLLIDRAALAVLSCLKICVFLMKSVASSKVYSSQLFGEWS